jgi:ABC-type glycerol-3-phosphate transport system permease component
LLGAAALVATLPLIAAFVLLERPILRAFDRSFS